ERSYRESAHGERADAPGRAAVYRGSGGAGCQTAWRKNGRVGASEVRQSGRPSLAVKRTSAGWRRRTSRLYLEVFGGKDPAASVDATVPTEGPTDFPRPQVRAGRPASWAPAVRVDV